MAFINTFVAPTPLTSYMSSVEKAHTSMAAARNAATLSDINDYAVCTLRESFGFMGTRRMLAEEAARLTHLDALVDCNRYVRARRTGSHYHLSRAQRVLVWQAVVSYHLITHGASRV